MGGIIPEGQTPIETVPLVSKRSAEDHKVNKKKKHTKRGESMKKRVSASDSAAKSLGFEWARAHEEYVVGHPLLSWDDYNALGREAKALHDTYMHQIKDPDTYQAFIPVEVPDEYHFYQEFGMKTFFVDFFDLHPLYNFRRLDISLVRAWALYQAKEAKWLKTRVAVLDPVLLQDLELGDVDGAHPAVVKYGHAPPPRRLRRRRRRRRAGTTTTPGPQPQAQLNRCPIAAALSLLAAAVSGATPPPPSLIRH